MKNIKLLDNQELVLHYRMNVAAMLFHLSRGEKAKYTKLFAECDEMEQEILRRLNNGKEKN